MKNFKISLETVMNKKNLENKTKGKMNNKSENCLCRQNTFWKNCVNYVRLAEEVRTDLNNLSP